MRLLWFLKKVGAITTPDEVIEKYLQIKEIKRRESVKESKERIKEYSDSVPALLSTIEAKDPYTYNHAMRVAEYSRLIAEEIGIPKEKRSQLEVAALLHDIGKIYIPDTILSKTSRLGDEEFLEIKKVPEIGARILREAHFPQEVINGVRHHHERYNGKGVPDGLKEEEIPLLARIIAVADAFEALTSTRAYRPSLGMEKALNEIRMEAKESFDPKIVKVFISVLKKEEERQDQIKK